jgi:hypothetical protein
MSKKAKAKTIANIVICSISCSPESCSHGKAHIENEHCCEIVEGACPDCRKATTEEMLEI